MKRIILVPGGETLPLNVPAPNVVERCKKAAELWQTGRYDFIILSGGIVQPSHIQTSSQAFLMRKWSHGKGIEGRKFILERYALDTYQNVEFSMSELKKRRIHRLEITVVSQWQHLLRFRVSFWKLFPEVPVEFVRVPGEVYFKEFLFLAYTLYDPCGVGWLAQKNRAARKRG